MRVALGVVSRFYREALAMALASEPGIDIVGTAGDGFGAAQLVITQRPAVLIIDPDLVLSPMLCSAITGMANRTRIVALDIPDESDQIVACAERGVTACVPPETSVGELVQILHQTDRDEVRVSPNVSASLMRRVAELAGSARLSPDAGGKQLTDRQCEIVELLDQGLMNKEIARKLGLSISTVKNHVHNALEELGLTSRQELARWYRVEHGAQAGRQALTSGSTSSRSVAYRDSDGMDRNATIAREGEGEGARVASPRQSLGLVDGSWSSSSPTPRNRRPARLVAMQVKQDDVREMAAGT